MTISRELREHAATRWANLYEADVWLLRAANELDRKTASLMELALAIDAAGVTWTNQMVEAYRRGISGNT